MTSRNNGAASEEGEPLHVRWAHLSAEDLTAVYTLMESTPPAAGEGVHAAARGYVLMLLKDYRNAADHFRRATRRGLSGDPGVNANLGYCYIQQRQFGGASRALDRALEEMPEDEVLLFLRAVVELEMSKHLQLSADHQYLDRLMAAQNPLAERLTTPLLKRRKQSTGTVIGISKWPPQSKADRETGESTAGISRQHLQVQESNVAKSTLFGTDPFPLAHIHAALANGVKLTTHFHPSVEDYLEMIHQLHFGSRVRTRHT